MGKRTFKIVLIKPSHYDDDGYVIQWRLSTIPSNSLASVYGLLAACAEEKALGPDVLIEIEACDECNTVIKAKAVAQRIKAAGGGFVGLVGVQSNQFPRALDLAREFRAEGLTVVIGGFHVSGCISMLPELTADLKEAQALGVILYAGEGEGRMADFIRDIDAGRAKPIYNYLNDMPGMEAAAIPVLPKEVVGRIVGHHACFDAGRGCPFQCSFCTIINVQGRKSRYRSADDVEAIVRANYAPGHQPLLRHRRQFRPEPQLGGDPGPTDRSENQQGHSDQADPSGRHALPQDPGLHREGGAGRLQPGLHRA